MKTKPRIHNFTTDHKALFEKLGKILLKAVGEEACQKGYGTTDPEWVGRYGLEYSDINPDGTLN